MLKNAIFSFVLLTFLSISLVCGQARRVPGFSESASNRSKKQLKKNDFHDQTPDKPRNDEKPETKQNVATTDSIESPDEIRVETNLVVIPVRISDHKGNPILKLQKEEFKLFENDIEQEIAFFSNEDQPFTVALVLDMSYSSVFKLEDIQRAALAFIEQLRENDRVLIVSFDEETHLLCEPTSDRRILRLAVEGTRIASGTSFYQALDFVLKQKLSQIAGRKAIVVLSDGVDTTSRKASPNDVLNEIDKTDVLVFPVKYDTYTDVQKSRKNEAETVYDDNDRPVVIEAPKIKGEREEDYKLADKFLANLAEQSGGRLFEVSSATNLNQAFASVANELRRIYSLGFYPKEKHAVDQRYHINVRVYRPNLIVKAKDNYLWRRD